MVRPELDPEKKTRWEAAAARFGAESGLPLGLTESEAVEIFLAGEWLADQLTEGGLDAKGVGDQCFANGQVYASRHMVESETCPWDVAREVRDKFLAGEGYEPGPDLALRLMEETLGRTFGDLEVQELMEFYYGKMRGG